MTCHPCLEKLKSTLFPEKQMDLTSFFCPHHFSSVRFSRSIMYDSLRPHGPQHARPPCPSPNPRVYSNSCPLSQWCHPTISFPVIPFSSCPQSLPTSGPLPMSQLLGTLKNSHNCRLLSTSKWPWPRPAVESKEFLQKWFFPFSHWFFSGLFCFSVRGDNPVKDLSPLLI